MRCITIVATLLALALPAAAAAPSGSEPNSAEAIQRWIANYRAKPDPAAVPGVVRALVKLGAFKDVETSGTQLGFIAGILGTNPARAEELVAKMLPLPDDAQWLVVRAIAYSGLPDWRSLLAKVADRLPARKVMIERTLAGKLPPRRGAPDHPHRCAVAVVEGGRQRREAHDRQHGEVHACGQRRARRRTARDSQARARASGEACGRDAR